MIDLARLNPKHVAPLAFAASGLLVLAGDFLPAIEFTPSPPQPSSIYVPARFDVPPLTAYRAIAMRSLFNQDRRPDPPPAPPAPPKPALPGAESYQLVGIILSSDLHMALVQRRSDSRVVRVQAGDTLDGWTVKSVSDDGVELNGPNAALQLVIPRAAQQSGAANPKVGDLGNKSNKEN
jgi:hypothetical protein